MEETLIEQLQSMLNAAFSVNYMVLDNFRHVDPTNHQGIYTRNDIFGPKSRKEQVYEYLYKDYAEIRNEAFSSIQEFLNSYNDLELFQKSAKDLVDIYNDLTKNDLNFSDVFTQRELKNAYLFEQMIEDINNSSLSHKDKTKFYLALNEFTFFYEQYKLWLSASEIFETLKEDITIHGSKSFTFGKPSNKNIKILNRDSFYEFIDPVLDFAIEHDKFLETQQKHLAKEIKKGKTELEDALDESLAKTTALKLIYVADSIFEKRFESATKKPEPSSKLNKIANDFLAKYIFKETPFVVDTIYVHKIELLDLAQAMSIFPELEEQSKLLHKFAVSDEPRLSQIIPQKENA